MDGRRRRVESRPVTPFGRLIREQRHLRGLSLDAVADAATAAGHPLTKSRLHQLETETLPTWPAASIVKGIAHVLKIPERVLSLALLESMGLDLPQMPSAEWLLLVSRGERLSPAERRRLMKTIETLLPDDDEGADQ